MCMCTCVCVCVCVCVVITLRVSFGSVDPAAGCFFFLFSSDNATPVTKASVRGQPGDSLIFKNTKDPGRTGSLASSFCSSSYFNLKRSSSAFIDSAVHAGYNPTSGYLTWQIGVRNHSAFS